ETSKRNAQLHYTWKIRGAFFFDCLGWWPPDDDTKPPDKGHPFYLHVALAQKEYRVHPRQEQVAGAWCHVVEFPGVDKLWVDPAIGFSVRRRGGGARNPPGRGARLQPSEYR